MASTYTPIATTTVSGTSTASVVFNSFSGYTDLYLVVTGREGSGSNDGGMVLRFNSDSGTNYSFTQLAGDGSTASSTRGTNNTSVPVFGISHPSATSYGQININIMNYANTTTYKTAIYGGFDTTSTNGLNALARRVALWRSTAAITSLTMTCNNGSNWASGSTFTLYGIAAA